MVLLNTISGLLGVISRDFRPLKVEFGPFEQDFWATGGVISSDFRPLKVDFGPFEQDF